MKRYKTLDTWHTSKYWYAIVEETTTFCGIKIKTKNIEVFADWYPLGKHRSSFLYYFDTGKMVTNHDIYDAMLAYSVHKDRENNEI